MPRAMEHPRATGGALFPSAFRYWVASPGVGYARLMTNRVIHRARRFVVLLGALVAILAVACGSEMAEDAVHVARATGAVDNVMERYVDRVLSQAEASGAVLVVLEVDTPGGEIGAMKRTVGLIEQSNVPVVTWTGPPGAQAVSAGTFIVMAGHIAAMAPSTSIGAASPVLAGGGEIPETLGRKVEEDTVSFARAVAEQHGRNADWAESAVREATSASPSEAVELGVIDLVVPTRAALLATVDGREVTMLDGSVVVISIAGAPEVMNEMNRYERVLKVVANPAVVGLLLLLGIAGIAIELFSPGVALPGTLGVLALVLAFLGAGVLLPGPAAWVLLALGLGLVAAEFFVPGGVLRAVGVAALLLALGIFAGQASTEVSVARMAIAASIVLIAMVGAVVFFLRYFLREAQSESRGWPAN